MTQPDTGSLNPLEQLTVEQLLHRTSMKWRAYADDVLPLWVAEMDVTLAEPIAHALGEAIGRGDTGYPSGARPYAEALAGFASRRWGWNGLDIERTAIVPDVMLGIVEVLRLISDPGDAVVVNSPVYPPFYAFVTHADRQIIEAQLNAAGRVEMEALEKAFAASRQVSDRVVYLLCNPHNPTGVVHTTEELANIASLARDHGVRVIADEIHAPLVLEGATFTPYLSVPGAENAFSMMSSSKAWNLAGLKAALAIAGPEAAHELRLMPEEVSHGPSHLGVIAHTVALSEGEQWLDALLAGLAANRALLGDLLVEHLPQVRWLPPEGTYLAWFDCRDLGLDLPGDTDGPGVVTALAGPAQAFLDQTRVALSSGHVFGSGGAGHVRLNFATSQAILIEAITRMGTVKPGAQSPHARLGTERP